MWGTLHMLSIVVDRRPLRCGSARRRMSLLLKAKCNPHLGTSYSSFHLQLEIESLRCAFFFTFQEWKTKPLFNTMPLPTPVFTKIKISQVSGNYDSVVETYDKLNSILQKFHGRNPANQAVYLSQVIALNVDIQSKLTGVTRQQYDYWYLTQIFNNWGNRNARVDAGSTDILKQLFLAKIGERSFGVIGSLNSEKATLVGQKATLESQKTTLQGQKATLQSEKATLQSQKTALLGEKATLESQKATLESEKATLQGQKTTLQSEKATLESDKKKLQGDLNKVTRECQKEKNEIVLANKDAQVDRLKKERDTIASEAKVPFWKRILNILN